MPPLVSPVLFVVFIAVFATLIEMVTPKGLDNLTVPLGVALITYLYAITMVVS
jgi:phytol kinase